MAVQTLTTTSFDFLHNTQHLDYIMNAMDYWPFARDYLIWNAAVAALQFGTADLEAHVLSSAVGLSGDHHAPSRKNVLLVLLACVITTKI